MVPSVRTYCSEPGRRRRARGRWTCPGSTRRIWARWARIGRSIPIEPPAAPTRARRPARPARVAMRSPFAEAHAADPVTTQLDRDHRAVLANAGPAPAGRRRRRPAPSGGRRRSRRAARRRTPRSRSRSAERPHLLRRVVADQLHLDPEALVHGDVGPQRAEVLRAHARPGSRCCGSRTPPPGSPGRVRGPAVRARPWRPASGCRSGSGRCRWTCRSRPSRWWPGRAPGRRARPARPAPGRCSVR